MDGNTDRTVFTVCDGKCGALRTFLNLANSEYAGDEPEEFSYTTGCESDPEEDSEGSGGCGSGSDTDTLLESNLAEVRCDIEMDATCYELRTLLFWVHFQAERMGFDADHPVAPAYNDFCCDLRAMVQRREVECASCPDR